MTEVDRDAVQIRYLDERQMLLAVAAMITDQDNAFTDDDCALLGGVLDMMTRLPRQDRAAVFGIVEAIHRHWMESTIARCRLSEHDR